MSFSQGGKGATPVLHSYSNLLHPYSTLLQPTPPLLRSTPLILQSYSNLTLVYSILLQPYSDLTPLYSDRTSLYSKVFWSTGVAPFPLGFSSLLVIFTGESLSHKNSILDHTLLNTITTIVYSMHIIK
jgi:hypothetical protein